MDVFYEESASPVGSKQRRVLYTVINVASYVFLVVGIMVGVFGMYFFPAPGAEKYDALLSIALFFVINAVLCFLVFLFCFFWKRRLNVSYDYAFVTGELRISRVYNVNKRKFINKINCEDILQIGDVDNNTFGRLKSDPSTKTVWFIANKEPSEGKFFMYILVKQNAGKILYVLECREELLKNVLMFAQRSALESDYIPQEKKQKRA